MNKSEFLSSFSYFQTVSDILNHHDLYHSLAAGTRSLYLEQKLAKRIYYFCGLIPDSCVRSFFPAIINLIEPESFDGEYLVEYYHQIHENFISETRDIISFGGLNENNSFLSW